MPSSSNYFNKLADRNRSMAEHGFDHFPDDGELLDYLIETNDKVDLLAGALGMRIEKDTRGRFRVAPGREGMR
ncbi:hypothetical protein [Ellagibacter isourolithinifaciens]|uniref:hypothetical protein n=1 Tax=Ellagibacter isourolithinifaciens TaxID=2137581 RepID=UPI0023F3C624|nr:hypothetical protein [Ellagibacter isourolithinifaciens]MDD5924974.1 hypothetical protein [Ellagibacter isourolithinifaciens]